MKLTYENENNQKIELKYSAPFFLQSIEGEYGLTNIITSNSNAYIDGSTVINTRIDNRYLSITGIIKTNTVNELIDKRIELIKIFNPKFKGKLVYENGDIKRVIDCYIEDAPKFTDRNVKIQKHFRISLYCPYPYWRDESDSKVDIALWEGGFHFPLIIPADSGVYMGVRNPSLIVNVNNTGDVESGVIIEFKALGTLRNPSLFNVNTREFFKINKAMVEGEVIRVNTNIGNKRVTQFLNGVETNILNLIDLESTFLQLKVGDNLFRYDAEENLNNLEVSIYYNPMYLGV